MAFFDSRHTMHDTRKRVFFLVRRASEVVCQFVMHLFPYGFINTQIPFSEMDNQTNNVL